MTRAWPAALLLAAGASGCAAAPPAATAEAWPAADALFHAEPRWLGSDAAYSVPLGGERVLWLFGDTFVATSPKHVRSEAEMVRSTVGVQTGLDPSQASMAFAWRTDPDGSPGAFFPPGTGDRWHWPLAGVRVGPGVAVVFLSVVRPTPGEGLGFAGDGWRLARLGGTDGASPLDWSLSLVDAPPSEHTKRFVVGSAAALDGEHVVALATRERPGGHEAAVARFRAEELAAGDATGIEWWTGAGWTKQAELAGSPPVVLGDAGPESSLSWDAARGRWLHVYSRGFGATSLALHAAPRPEGPWSSAADVFRPPEDDRVKPFVYAGKGHPELLGADLVLTYATNSFDFAELVADTTLYYPRFVRLTWR